jgi:peptide subunit release factor 1 (eRF1)
MTSELRTLVELQDIRGLELECPKCHAKFLYPLHNSPSRKKVCNCPGCGAPWFVTEHSSDAPDQILKFLSDLETLSKDKDIYAKIRLSVSLKNENS